MITMTPRARSSSLDSLFSEPSTGNNDSPGPRPASRSAPPIPGLYIFPGLLPQDVAFEALKDIGDADHFVGGSRDQVMFFGLSAFPSHLQRLLTNLRDLVASRVPLEVFEQPLARQAILNLYPPGQGISPHVDLPNRYADGILGGSLCGGCVIDFSKQGQGEEETLFSKQGQGEEETLFSKQGQGEEELHSVYLPPRSVYVLTGEARWEWAHGIDGRTHDVVLDDRGVKQTVQRGLRVSVTYRWMKEGGEALL